MVLAENACCECLLRPRQRSEVKNNFKLIQHIVHISILADDHPAWVEATHFKFAARIYPSHCKIMDALLARLQELSLPHEPIAHAVAMTVEEQVGSCTACASLIIILLDSLKLKEIIDPAHLNQFLQLCRQKLSLHTQDQ